MDVSLTEPLGEIRGGEGVQRLLEEVRARTGCDFREYGSVARSRIYRRRA